MEKLTVSISDETYKEFRHVLIDLDKKRGVMSEIVEAGLKEWIKAHKK